MDAPNVPARAEAGAVIGGYELVRRLGRGGMAEVWVARRALGKKGTKFVAIKMIVDHYVGDERYARMFRTEAELAAVLSHANIVQVFDEGEDGGRSYLVMEWVDGLNLLKLGAVLALLDDDDRRFRVTAYIIGQLLYALGYAHSITSFDGNPLGVVHRDVSPQNVMISNHGEVKLTDFGVAYHVLEESSGIHVKGKVRYMPPEQLSGQSRSPTVDLYAVGALLHELLDGRKFRGEYDDGRELFSAVLSGVIPPLSRPAPPELDELRRRLLAANPIERIQSAEDALRWLQRYPGYGDARSDLTKLCGSLTGVVRPRAGPGQSSQMAMADRRTTKFKGDKRLARPQVDPKAPGPAASPRVPPPPPAAAAAPGGRRTVRPLPRPIPPPISIGASPLAANDPSLITTGPTTPRAKPTMPAITGPTQSIRPASVPGPPTPVVPPTQPLAAMGRPSVLAPAVAMPIPVVAPTEKFSPSLFATTPNVTGVTELVSHAAVAEMVANGAPAPAVPAWQPAQPQPAPTPYVAVPEQLAVVPVWPRDNTNPSRSNGTVPTHSNSISIVLPKPSTLAVMVVVLVVVAAASVAVTWWLFTRGDNRGGADQAAVRSSSSETQPSPGVAAATPSPGVDAPADPDFANTRASSNEPAPAPPTEAEAVPAPTDPSPPETPAAVTVPAAASEASAEDTDDVEAEIGADAEPKASPSATKTIAKAIVVISCVGRVAGAQVRIGSQVIDVPASRTVTAKIRAGTHRMAWRLKASDPWKSVNSVTFRSGRERKLILSETTLRPTS